MWRWKTLLSKSATRHQADSGKEGGNTTVASTGHLFKYCIDDCLVREGKLDPIIGRDKEVRTIMEMGRRTKPNVIIVGEPGVVTPALVDGFVLELIAQKVPVHLQVWPSNWIWVR